MPNSLLRPPTIAIAGMTPLRVNDDILTPTPLNARRSGLMLEASRLAADIAQMSHFPARIPESWYKNEGRSPSERGRYSYRLSFLKKVLLAARRGMAGFFRGSEEHRASLAHQPGVFIIDHD